MSRAQYAKLFDVIGTTFGAGDDASTFKLPIYEVNLLEVLIMVAVSTLVETSVRIKKMQSEI